MGRPLGASERAILDRLNDGIRDLAARRGGVVLADIAAHFAGHGLSAPTAEQWYWPHMIIEPSARGASEVRRLWLQALGALKRRPKGRDLSARGFGCLQPLRLAWEGARPG